jgi:cytochrome P450
MSKSTSTIVDPLLSPTHDFYQNPYPVFKRLREEAPVLWSEKGGYWLVTRYADAHSIISDNHFEKGQPRWKSLDMFAKLFQGSELAQFRATSMLNQNPPDHTRTRSLVNKAFTPKMISQMRGHVTDIANQLLDDVQNKGKMDLVADFAYPLPAIVIAEMLGVPAEDRNKFKDWSHDITAVLEPAPNLFNIGTTMKGYNHLTGYLKPLIESRRKERKDDLISALVDAEEEGSKLTEHEVLSNVVLLFMAGHETTANLIGNGTLALLRNPAALNELKEKPELLPTAVDEFLRYDGPVQMVRRIAGEDWEIGGMQIKQGQSVFILPGAANRDSDEFGADSEELNIHRTPNRHIAFGHGIHHCLGAALARLEGEIALGLLLKRMPNLKLATQNPEYKQPFTLRGVKELHLTF